MQPLGQTLGTSALREQRVGMLVTSEGGRGGGGKGVGVGWVDRIVQVRHVFYTLEIGKCI